MFGVLQGKDVDGLWNTLYEYAMRPMAQPSVVSVSTAIFNATLTATASASEAPFV